MADNDKDQAPTPTTPAPVERGGGRDEDIQPNKHRSEDTSPNVVRKTDENKDKEKR
ncbi:MAG: hypothetical protein LAO20_16480 [Acidobacteriia bacterium]|nr:hypothetical protein [Terriglobia bacterium]